MIKANELRIGNWLYYESTIDDEKPAQINGSDIATFEILKGRYSPIPLTNDILLKCGFKNSVGNNYHYKNCRIWFTDERVFFFINYEQGDDSFSIRKEIKYLHQLQNLYFSLTNEELEIKL